MQIDKNIIIRIKEGNRSAFGELLDICQDILFRFVLTLVKDEDDARDIIQETFIKVWDKIHRFDPQKNFTPWLYKIAHNLCKDYWRRKTSIIRRNEIIHSSQYESENPNEIQKINIIHHLDILPKQQKLIYILRDMQELPIADISAILRVSQSSVKTNLCYARRTLYKHLTKMNQVNKNEL